MIDLHDLEKAWQKHKGTFGYAKYEVCSCYKFVKYF